MLPEEKIMEVLEAYDLTLSLRSAAMLCGVDHHTVARYVAAREAGLDPLGLAPPARGSVTDPFAEKIIEWIDRSQGRIRADVVHRKLDSLGYQGSERTTRRVVAALKREWRRTNARAYKPWIPEPGLWLQWDYGDGPVVGGRKTVLFCAWLAWSRFRVILALPDRTLPSVIAAWDRCFRILGGAPTYLLTDNEKTVTDRHVARLAVRNPKIVSAAVYYGVSVRTCVPADPESKGGSESTVRLAKADVVPTDANLLAAYDTFAALEEACTAAMERFNTRVHAVTRRVPAEMLTVEREHLHPVPAEAYTVAFGESRAVSWSSTVNYGGARYSVPYTLRDTRVWVRVAGETVVIVADGPGGAAEVARHPHLSPGGASIRDEHYPPRDADPLERQPKATNRHEAAFLALGEGAKRWLSEAAAIGARGIEARMAEAVELARIVGERRVDEALGLAAFAGRFAAGDLASILDARTDTPRRADPSVSLQPGTSPWAALGGPTPPAEPAGDPAGGDTAGEERWS
ncbi:IS21 family transposase [Acidimicrobiaceae bacterium USS-CC1]|uniref:IS21 family transposase n=1 Tax=Acidiferrimicrobium australe TaxID=2664430 RepID=A0ABW9QRE3_9ACTN|nr:IS21 family transposase [Acidiferrimicrobium australe]